MAIPGRRRVARWQQVVTWFLGVVVLGALGSYAAYHGPLSSEAWILWAKASTNGVDPTELDFIRLFVAASLAMYGLFCMAQVTTQFPDPSTTPATALVMSKSERLIVAAVVTLLTVAAFYVLPANFHNEYAREIASGRVHPTVADPLSFREIYVPYWDSYFLYVFALWLGVVSVVFFVMIRCLRNDVSILRKAGAELAAPAGDASPLVLTAYRFSYVNYFSAVQDIGNHYVPVLMVVIAISFFEELTNLRCSVLQEAAALGVLALWLIWIPCLCLTLALYGVLYARSARRARNGLRRIADQASATSQGAQTRLNALSGTPGAGPEITQLEAKRKEQDDIFEKATSQISDIDDKRTPINGLFAILKSGNVGVALLFSVVCFALFKLFISHENIAYAIAPHEIVDWIFKTLFGQPPTAPPLCKP